MVKRRRKSAKASGLYVYEGKLNGGGVREQVADFSLNSVIGTLASAFRKALEAGKSKTVRVSARVLRRRV